MAWMRGTLSSSRRPTAAANHPPTQDTTMLLVYPLNEERVEMMFMAGPEFAENAIRSFTSQLGEEWALGSEGVRGSVLVNEKPLRQGAETTRMGERAGAQFWRRTSPGAEAASTNIGEASLPRSMPCCMIAAGAVEARIL